MNFVSQTIINHNVRMNTKVLDKIESMDPHMLPLLKAFNQGNQFTTRFCCEGHKEEGNRWGYISFDGVLPNELICACMNIFADYTKGIRFEINKRFNSIIKPDGEVRFDTRQSILSFSLHYLVKDKELLCGVIADRIKTEVGQYYADPINYQYQD